MRKLVYRLRELPESDKRAILNLSIVFVSLALFGLWSLTLRHNLTALETQVKMKRDLEPLKNFSGGLTAGYNLLEDTENK